MIGTTELVLIGGLILLLFGGKKLPEMMHGMGKGVKSFKEGLNEPTDAERQAWQQQQQQMQQQQMQQQQPLQPAEQQPQQQPQQQPPTQQHDNGQ